MRLMARSCGDLAVIAKAPAPHSSSASRFIAGAAGFLEFQPVLRSAATIRRAEPLGHDALEALRRTVSPNARLAASCGGLGFDIAFFCYPLGKLGPALTEEGLGYVVVADPAHGFGRACSLPEAAADGLPL